MIGIDRARKKRNEIFALEFSVLQRRKSAVYLNMLATAKYKVRGKYEDSLR